MRLYLSGCTPMAWQSMAIAVVCPLLIQSLVLAGAFEPDRNVIMHVCSVVFLLFGVDAAVRRRVTPVSFWAQCLEAFAMVVVVGSSTHNLGVVVACVTAVPLVLIDGAAVRTLVEVAILTVLGSSAVGVLLLLHHQGAVTTALSCAAVALLSGAAAGIVLAFRTRSEAATRGAHVLARTDSLTGLLNRHGLAVAAPGVVAQARREGAPLGVLLVDVDNFKLVNDVHGHATGDRVLRQVADVVRAVCWRDEVVARIGGEEICVVVVCDEPDQLARLGERLRMEVAAGTTEPAVTVSVGAAAATLDRLAADPGATGPDSLETERTGADEIVLRLVDQADTALYEVKRSGRNGVRVWSGTTGTSDSGRREGRAPSMGRR